MIYQIAPRDFKPEFEVVSCFCEYNGEILLLRRMQARKDAYSSKWGLPAGKVRPQESLVEAVIREVKEETGINLYPNELIYLDKVYVRYPEYDYHFHSFITKLVTRPEILLNPKEHDDFVWAYPSKILTMDLILDGDEVFKKYYPNAISD